MTFIERLTKSRGVLLVQPMYPSPQRSRNHHDFCPLPLLKFASFLRDHGVPFKLIDYSCIDEMDLSDIDVDMVLCSTSFTYYSDHVRDCVQYFKKLYPRAEVICGGIYATLLPLHCKQYTECDTVIRGVVREVEHLSPAYDIVDTGYQIIHTSRGCVRNCKWCGTYKIEPYYTYKRSIRREITKKKIIFYDNNLLANPYIEEILNELIRLRRHGKIRECDAQSGIDGRLLTKNIAEKLYTAGFKHITIAWDNKYDEREQIREQIQTLQDAGYKSRNIQVFILYNYEITYKESEQKRAYLSRLGVQTVPCRYIPLHATSDGYNPYKRKQNRDDYYIHPTWTDAEVRAFKRNCRQHNICKRFNTKYWTRKAEKRQLNNEEFKALQNLTKEEARTMGVFDPDETWEATSI